LDCSVDSSDVGGIFLVQSLFVSGSNRIALNLDDDDWYQPG
jgi:hypothetical protein